MEERVKEMEEAGKEMRERTDAISYSVDEMAEAGVEMGEPEEEMVKMDGFLSVEIDPPGKLLLTRGSVNIYSKLVFPFFLFILTLVFDDKSRYIQ